MAQPNPGPIMGIWDTTSCIKLDISRYFLYYI